MSKQPDSKPILKRAFCSLGTWHIWDALAGNSTNGYEIAYSLEEVLQLMYQQGYSLKAIDRHNNYFFELKRA